MSISKLNRSYFCLFLVLNLSTLSPLLAFDFSEAQNPPQFSINLAFQTYWTDNGVALCQGSVIQYWHEMISDGQGGAYIFWSNYSNGGNIYGQRISANGDLLWGPFGTPICTQSGLQSIYALLDTENDEIFAIWTDMRSGNSDIYAQKINSTGDIQWTVDGKPVVTKAGDQNLALSTTDGQGGAIITWWEGAASTSNVFAQRINSTGDINWTSTGVSISSANYAQNNQEIVSDGNGGAIIVWDDFRSNSHWDIYVNKINSSGQVKWSNGRVLCGDLSDQSYAKMIADGYGGAIVVWEDERNGFTDIYGQRIDADGNDVWATDGISFCNAPDYQSGFDLLDYGSNQFLLEWSDRRSGLYNIYLQKIDINGNTYWGTNGVPACTSNTYQTAGTLIRDSSGNALVVWSDRRDGLTYDIYGQAFNPDGDRMWGDTGKVLCNAGDDQGSKVTIINSGTDSGILAWQDHRSGSAYHIYAQKITHVPPSSTDDDDDDSDKDEEITISFGSFYVFFAILGIMGAGILLKRKLTLSY